jgi:signal transduction histidine kinase
VAVSDAYLQATMTEHATIMGQTLFAVFPDDPAEPWADGVRNLRASLDRVTAHARADVMAVQRYPIARPASEGGGFEERWWSPINSPVFGPDGDLAYIIHRVEDVTPLIRHMQEQGREADGLRLLESRAQHMEAEIVLRAQDLQRVNEQLRTSEARYHALVEEFVATVSHELQTPLTALRAGLTLLELGAGPMLGPAERELLEAMRRNAERLRLHIADLLTARALQGDAPPPARAPVDLRAVVTDAVAAVQPLIREKRQPLELDLPAPLPVAGDARLLEQAVVNLLANAQRHTPPGTHITVSGRARSDEVHLAVHDTGPGIPASALEAIFERFRRLGEAPSSTGLGLAIARDAVRLHGGRLWAESAEGRGATFHLVLPHAMTEEDGA